MFAHIAHIYRYICVYIIYTHVYFYIQVYMSILVYTHRHTTGRCYSQYFFLIWHNSHDLPKKKPTKGLPLCPRIVWLVWLSSWSRKMDIIQVMERIVASKSEACSKICGLFMHGSQFILLELVNNTTCGFTHSSVLKSKPNHSHRNFSLPIHDCLPCCQKRYAFSLNLPSSDDWGALLPLQEILCDLNFL